MTEPNWPEINRRISDSIEPKPDIKVAGAQLEKRLIAWIAVRREDFPEPVEWEPRDWREPAAAMELLKRMPEPRLQYYRTADNPWSCETKWTAQFQGHGSEEGLGQTPEEAIVLAYYATLEEKPDHHGKP